MREIHGALAKTSVAQVCPGEVLFLDEIFRNLVVDVQPDSQGGLNTLPFSVMMALGCDILLAKPLLLDFRSKQIDYLPENIVNASGALRLPADFSLGLPVFHISLGGRQIKAVFDTGGGLSVLNQRLLSDLQSGVVEEGAIEVEDATGVRQAIPIFGSSGLIVGDRLLSNCQFLVIDLSATEQEKDVQIDFVFGLNAMADRRWVVSRQGAFIEMA